MTCKSTKRANKALHPPGIPLRSMAAGELLPVDVSFMTLGVMEVVKAWKLPGCLSSEFGEFYRYRIVAGGVQGAPTPPTADVLAVWIERAGSMLDRLETQTDEPHTFVHQ